MNHQPPGDAFPEGRRHEQGTDIPSEPEITPSFSSLRSETTDTNVLREPASRDWIVRARSRLTVRELMEKLDMAPSYPQKSRSTASQWMDQSQPVYQRIDDGGIWNNDETQPIPKVKRRLQEQTVELSSASPTNRGHNESSYGVLRRTPAPAELATKGRLTEQARRELIRRDARIAGRFIAVAACAFALVGTGTAWSVNGSLNNSWRNIKAIDGEDKNISRMEEQYGDENYLIVGTDTRAGKNAKFGAGDATETEGSRSDTVILINIPANRSRVVAVSFPRDLAVERPECEGFNDNTGKYTGEQMPAEVDVKLNSVYATGGPKCLVKTITKISGLNINHFIGMDFVAFRKIVDTLGGVYVCSTTPLYDYEIGTVLPKAGRQKLNGRKALKYVRARMLSTEGNGDYGRIHRQQLFMSSLLRATLSSNVLSNPAKLQRVARVFTQNSYVDNVDTESLLNLADSMRGLEAGRVTFITIPTSGTSTDGQNNEIPRTEDISDLFDAIITDKPLPGEKPKPKTKSGEDKKGQSPKRAAPPVPAIINVSAMSPSKVGVRILNGTHIPGLAQHAQEQLSEWGFEVRGIADSHTKLDHTVVRYGPDQRNAAGTLAHIFSGAKIQADPSVKSGVEVILGSEYTTSTHLKPYAKPGTQISVGQLSARIVDANLPNDLAVTNAGDVRCD